jgi:hypothetical protein
MVEAYKPLEATEPVERPRSDVKPGQHELTTRTDHPANALISSPPSVRKVVVQMTLARDG